MCNFLVALFYYSRIQEHMSFIESHKTTHELWVRINLVIPSQNELTESE